MLICYLANFTNWDDANWKSWCLRIQRSCFYCLADSSLPKYFWRRLSVATTPVFQQANQHTIRNTPEIARKQLAQLIGRNAEAKSFPRYQAAVRMTETTILVTKRRCKLFIDSISKLANQSLAYFWAQIPILLTELLPSKSQITF